MKHLMISLTVWLTVLANSAWSDMSCLQCRMGTSPKMLIEGVNEEACEYYLSICAIFQNEARWFKEWLEFHRLVGVEHFYLYNNNSTDHYREILEPYIAQGVVDLIEWPTSEEEGVTHTQYQVYNHCIGQCVGHTRWLAVIDLDEFLAPVVTSDLPSYLKEYDSVVSLGGIMVYWQFYGTSWISKLGEDELLIERMVCKMPEDDGWNHQVKTICKPHKVAEYFVHGASYKPRYWDATTNGLGGPHRPTQIDQLRINHYWTRDEDFLLNIKKPRREKYEGAVWSEESIDHFRHWMNSEEDRFMDRFVPELRKRMRT